MTLLSKKLKPDFTADFAKLKTTAKSVDDICEWFKQHPQLIPGLAPQFYKNIEVDYASSEQFVVDVENKTVYEEYVFYFTIQSVDVELETEQLTNVTGLDFRASKNTKPFFRVEYEVTLDIHDWKFLAIEDLLDLDESVFDDPVFGEIYQKAVSIHFPQFSWPTFAALWQAGLVPDDKDEFEAFLCGVDVTTNGLEVPGDLSI